MTVETPIIRLPNMRQLSMEKIRSQGLRDECCGHSNGGR